MNQPVDDTISDQNVDNTNSQSDTTTPPVASPNDQHIREGDSIVEPLTQDNAAPFSPPTDAVNDAAIDLDSRLQGSTLDPTHQATDNATDIDSQQLYDEGLAGAAEAHEPNAGNAVVDYDPQNDQRKQDAA